MIILIDPQLCRVHADLAQGLLEEFVSLFGELYGSSHIVYNVHSLLHLVDDVKLYGPLDNYSAFPFESYMHTLKSMLHRNNNPLPEICNRVEESYYCHDIRTSVEDKVKFKKPDKFVQCKYYEILFFKFVINCKKRDQWFMGANQDIYKFEYCKLENNVHVVYARTIVRKSSFYNVPISSDKFGIYKSNGVLSEIVSVSLKMIDKKVFAMLIDNEFVFAPL